MTTPVFSHSVLVDWDNNGLWANAHSDITAYVLSGDWTMGRQQSTNMSGPINMASIGSGSLTVRNETGLFTNTSLSPLSGKLVPRRYVRIFESVIFKGVTNYLYSGQQVYVFTVSGGATTVTVSNSAPFLVGEYILIDSEYMLITSIGVSGGLPTLTVTRAQLGSVAAIHNIGAKIYGDHKCIFYGVIRSITSQSSSKTTNRQATIELADLLYVLQSTKVGVPIQYNQTLDSILQAYVSTALGEPASSLSVVFNSDPANGSFFTFSQIPNVVGQQPGAGTLIIVFDNSATVTTPNHVQCGNGAAATAANFAAFINQTTGLNTTYGAPTVPISDFQAVVTGGTTVTLTSVLSGLSTCCNFAAFLTGTGTAISLAGSTTNGVSRPATGGTDWPIQWDSPRKSRVTVPVAAQRWTKKDTFAYTAIKEMVDTEFGRFYQDHTGTLVFHSRDYNFTRLVPAPDLTDSTGLGNYTLRTSDDDTYGVVRVTSTPNIAVNKGVVLGKVTGASVPGNSTKTIHIPYTDWQSGAPCGGVPTLPLVPGQDWNVNEKADGSGIDYTPGYYSGATNIFLSYTPLASGLDVIVKNTATGTLYFVPPTTPKAGQSSIATLQARGNSITNFSTVLSEKDTDTTRRIMAFTLPMTNDTNYADSVANYLSGRYGTDNAKIVDMTYGEKGLYPVAGGQAILNLSIDSTLSYARASDNIATTLLEVVGMKFHIEPHQATVTLFTWPVDSTSWFILDHATFGLLNGTNRLSI